VMQIVMGIVIVMQIVIAVPRCSAIDVPYILSRQGTAG
jgi:hypothetical protein